MEVDFFSAEVSTVLFELASTAAFGGRIFVLFGGGRSGGTSRPSSFPNSSKKSPAISRFRTALAAVPFSSGLSALLVINGLVSSSSSSESSEKIA